MKISVVIPVYNTEKFISRAIDSVLAQDYKDYEIICIDDGSKDKSAQIIKEKANTYSCIKYYYQENQGPGIARKNGYLKTMGDLIYFMDSDDYLIDNSAFSKIIDVYNKYNSDIIFFNINILSKNKELLVRPYCGNNLSEHFNEFDQIRKLYITANLLSKVFKRSLIEESMFIESNTFEDFYTSYLYLDKCSNYYYLNDVLYNVDHTEENINHISLVENIEKKKKRFSIIAITYSKINNKVIKECIANYCSQVIIGEITLRTKHFFDFKSRINNKKIKLELKDIIKILNESEFKYKPSGKFKLFKKILYKLFLITHK